jgi:hypothetical protein
VRLSPFHVNCATLGLTTNHPCRLIRTSLMLILTCCYLMWAIAYLAQLHPLEGTHGDLRFFSIYSRAPSRFDGIRHISPEGESCAGALRCSSAADGEGRGFVHSYVRRWSNPIANLGFTVVFRQCGLSYSIFVYHPLAKSPSSLKQ